jgi:hypothetical protein
MTEATVRINARLDDGSARKLGYLTDAMHASVTDVIKAAIDHYYGEVRARHRSGGAALLDSGFVGCAEGDEDLSLRYKEHLAAGLAAKHDHR